MPTSPPYSYVTFTVTSGMVATPEFSYASIGLLPDGLVDKSVQLQVYLNGVQLTYTTDYTFISGSKIDISATIAVSDIVTIVRNTEKGTRYVDFSDNNLLTQEDMDNSALQQFYISQQAYDKAYASITLDSSKTWWQGNNKQIKNVGPATESSSAITKAQMQAYVTGGVIAEIDDYRIYSYDGGLNTDFALASNLYGITAKQVIVTINGELQQTSDNASGTNNSPGAANGYTLVNVGGVPTVRFADPVANGASVSIRVIKGTYATTPQSGGILSDAIADDSITLAKLSFVDGVADRFLTVATDGTASLTTLTTSSLPDFDTAVQAKTLDEFGTPVAAVQFGGQQITGIADGTAATHAVSKSQMDTAIAAISNVSIYTGAISALLYAASPAYRTYTNPDGAGFDILQIDWYSTAGATYPASSAGRVAAIYGTDTFPMAVSLTGSSGAITCYITRTATGFTVYRSTATGGNVSMRFKYTVLS